MRRGWQALPLSDAVSKDLKKRGMKFVGTTIIYAYLQAVGVDPLGTKRAAFWRTGRALAADSLGLTHRRFRLRGTERGAAFCAVRPDAQVVPPVFPPRGYAHGAAFCAMRPGAQTFPLVFPPQGRSARRRFARAGRPCACICPASFLKCEKTREKRRNKKKIEENSKNPLRKMRKTAEKNGNMQDFA